MSTISLYLTHFYLACLFSELKLEEMVLPEDKVLEKLNTVSMAKRLANMVSCLLL